VRERILAPADREGEAPAEPEPLRFSVSWSLAPSPWPPRFPSSASAPLPSPFVVKQPLNHRPRFDRLAVTTRTYHSGGNNVPLTTRGVGFWEMRESPEGVLPFALMSASEGTVCMAVHRQGSSVMKRIMSCAAVLAMALMGTPHARATADRVFAVGSNEYGQLGIGEDTWSPGPAHIKPLLQQGLP